MTCCRILPHFVMLYVVLSCFVIFDIRHLIDGIMQRNAYCCIHIGTPQTNILIYYIEHIVYRFINSDYSITISSFCNSIFHVIYILFSLHIIRASFVQVENCICGKKPIVQSCYIVSLCNVL